MHFKNREETLAAIEDWRPLSPAAQTRNLRQAIKSMEMDQMYYEQKGNSVGSERCDECLELFMVRLSEVE